MTPSPLQEDTPEKTSSVLSDIIKASQEAQAQENSVPSTQEGATLPPGDNTSLGPIPPKKPREPLPP